MPWWMWMWAGVLTLMTIGGAAMDWSDDEPRWYTAMGVASGLACVAFVLNYGGVIHLGNVALPAILALGALLYEMWRDLGRERELTPGKKWLAAILTLVPFVPAVFMGITGTPE